VDERHGRPRRRTTRIAVALAAAACALGASREARAQQKITTDKGFNADGFMPAMRGSDWFVLDSLDLRGDARLGLGLTGEYAYKPLVITNADGSERAAVVGNQLFMHLGASFVVLERVRLGFDLPFGLYDDGTSTQLGPTVFNAPTKAQTMGDARFAIDVRVFGEYGKKVTGAVGIEGFAPTGSRAEYTSDGDARFLPQVKLAGTAKRIEWAGRLGVLFRTSDDPIAGQQRGHSLVFSAAAGYRAPKSKLIVGPELYGSTSITKSASVNSPLELLFGVHYQFEREWRVGLGAGPGLGPGLGEPILRTALTVEYYALPVDEDESEPVHHRRREAHDRDKDSVPDTIDACPDQKGVPSDDPALNGCPPIQDMDMDSIPDTADACPEEAGVPNANPELNGCPPDADEDGVPDKLDACPMTKGVEQQDPKTNGCPPDSDHDGVPDETDACPDQVGLPNKDPQLNGCPPDPDLDKDGILNDEDACPNEPGAKDPDPKKNGCPKAILRGSEIRILDQVRFDAASARITPTKDSLAVLNAVAKVLKEHTEITKIEIQGHTDNRGDPKANKKLSEARAKAVVAWLAGHGVAAARMTATGFGDERPLDTNATEDGRKANRRVEFHVTQTSKPDDTKGQEASKAEAPPPASEPAKPAATKPAAPAKPKEPAKPKDESPVLELP
jgi:outer membrane protein OmpA-like peptidoglycan-associated protein